ncbi:MAG TPA: hypothetical protein VG276_28100 [Actinomycetes bacterium]|jgi:DNA-binding Xre family transcriptional regulator|nr:hypothetical protein [Actinomycetes bacterium]
MTVSAPRQTVRGNGQAKLPSEPLVEAIRAYTRARNLPLTDILGRNTAAKRAFERAGHNPTVAVTTVEKLCAVLGCHPSELYGDAYDPSAARRQARQRPGSRHWAARIPLTTYQAIYDAMAATAVNGRWTGHLTKLVADVAPDTPYNGLQPTLTGRGWITVEQRGMGGTRGDGRVTARPSIYRLVRRPEAETWPCETCGEPITSVTDDGYLIFALKRYCSERCGCRAQEAAYGRKLDRLRETAGLPRTGRRRLSAAEVDDVVRLLRRLRMRSG